MMKIPMILLTCVLSPLAWGLFPTSACGADTAIVSRVMDGDTLAIVLNGKPETLRPIGVDTLEVHVPAKLHRDAYRTGQDNVLTQALGRRASDFVKTLIRSGDRISLEYDWQRRDKHGPLLAFMWLADGRMLNEVLICEGHAPALTRYPFRRDYMERLRDCERQARAGAMGRQNRAVGAATATTACYQGVADVPCTPNTHDPAVLRIVTVAAGGAHKPPLQYNQLWRAIEAAQPGDYIQVKGGTYIGGPTIGSQTFPGPVLNVSGTRANPITIINHPSAMGANMPIIASRFETKSNTKWFVVQGMRFTNKGEAGNGEGFYSFSTNFAVRNNYFDSTAVCGVFGRFSDALFEGNTFERNGFGLPGDCGASGSGLAYICNNAPEGPTHCNDGQRYGHCHGVYSSSTDFTQQNPPKNITISRNIFDRNSGSGWQTQGQTRHFNFLIENNIFFDNPIAIWGLGLDAGNIRNNTIIQTHIPAGSSGQTVPTTRPLGFAVHPGAGLGNTKVANNIVYVALASPFSNQIFSSATALPRFAHNGFFYPSGTSFGTNGDNDPFYTMNPTNYVQQTGDVTSQLHVVQKFPNNENFPGFTTLASTLAASNLHLVASSPLVNAGDNTNCAPHDFDGNPRRDGQCDIGAFERQ